MSLPIVSMNLELASNKIESTSERKSQAIRLGQAHLFTEMYS